MSYDIFISYSRRDNAQRRITDFVERIKADFALTAHRELVPFFDVQEIHGMQDWRQRILQGLRESRLLISCVSPAYLRSEYCEWEFVEYLKYEVGHLHGFNGVAPIYFVEVPGWTEKVFDQRCAGWVAELRKRQHFDLRAWRNQGEEAVREALAQGGMRNLNDQIVWAINRAERAEKSLGNVDAHNPHFIGRTANLRMLRENFVSPGQIGVVTAVNGLGGLGKTALAIEYAHAFADEYGGGRWQVRCAGKEDLRLALAELATPIGIGFTDEEKQHADLQFDRIRSALKKLADARSPYRCLLLLDNVDRPGLLDPAQVARLNGGDWLHVLATTQLGENELHGAHSDRSFLAIDELPPEDALALIEGYQRPNGRFRSDAERDAGREIVRLLGCFTLAVESAAVYLGEFAEEVTCAAFLARLKKEGLEGLDAAAGQSTTGVRHGEKRLDTTLQPTLERLGPAEKLTLEFAALLPPDQVPLPWLRALVTKTFPEMEHNAEPGYPDPWKNVLRRLFSLRLLQTSGVVDSEGRLLVGRVHRVVQESVRKHIADLSHALQITEFASARVKQLKTLWVVQESRWELEPVRALAYLWMDLGLENGGYLANEYSFVCCYLARHRDAEMAMQRALEFDEQRLGPSHPAIAVRLSNLAHLLQIKNLLARAETLSRRAVAIDELHFEKDPDSHLGAHLSNLGYILMRGGRDIDAELIFNRALTVYGMVKKTDRGDVGATLSNLGELLRRNGRLSQAEDVLKRSLSEREKDFGTGHPEVANSLLKLGLLYMDQAKTDAAEPLLTEALSIDEDVLGPSHPKVARDLDGLAQLSIKRKRWLDAETFLRRALSILEKDGVDELEIGNAANKLARVLGFAGQVEESLKVRRDTAHRQERMLSPEHPDTLRSWNDYGVALGKEGHAQLAEAIQRKVAATTAKVLGNDNSLTIHRHSDWVLTLIMLGKHEEADEILTSNCRLNAPPRANVTPRVVFLRYLVSLLKAQPDTTFLGQLKTLFSDPALALAPDVPVLWDIAYFMEHLKPKLGKHDVEILTVVAATMNDRAMLLHLDRLPEWRDQACIPV